VAQADEVLVGRLLRRLDELGIAANTVVCLVSDHGEEILEHGNAGHGKELYVESARVPWILRGPGAPAGVARRGPVELADAAATLAALLGLPPDPLVHGRDRLAASEDEEDVHPLVLAHRFDYAPARRDALVLGPWKLMRSGEGGGEPRLELFRVDQDPLEREDLAARDAARARALSLALDLSLRRLAELRATLPGGAAELSPEVLRELQERMRELGYLEE
jgi:arylsulfatase A-like enzyme